MRIPPARISIVFSVPLRSLKKECIIPVGMASKPDGGAWHAVKGVSYDCKGEGLYFDGVTIVVAES